MTTPIRWGILGTGNIAKQFAGGLESLPDAELLAVGSRAQDSADAFGDKFNVPRRYARYEDLVEDGDIDAIYVATPHHLHKENSIMCLRAGKAVLCEKPFTINAREAEELIAVAGETNLFLMEAMWTRFLPIICQVRAWIDEGAIGEVRMMIADFGFRTSVEEESRLFDPAAGGGALLDVGVYTVSFASMVFGQQPDRIAGLADIGQTRVDEQNAVVFGYPGGQLALLSSATRTETFHEAIIYGAEGSIRVHAPFWRANAATLKPADGKEQTVELPYTGNGYNYEAEEVARCIRAGKTQSDMMPLDESLDIMRTMDAIRAQWGLVYPMEK